MYHSTCKVARMVWSWEDVKFLLCYGCGWNIRCKFLPAYAQKLLENVPMLKLRRLQKFKIILKLVKTVKKGRCVPDAINFRVRMQRAS